MAAMATAAAAPSPLAAPLAVQLAAPPAAASGAGGAEGAEEGVEAPLEAPGEAATAAAATAAEWQEAFEAVRRECDFAPLGRLLESERSAASINAGLDWDGQRLTPLFVAVLLQLEDLLPQFLARGAGLDVRCVYQGLLCGPVHAAALRCDVPALQLLLSLCEGAGGTAETDVRSVGAGNEALEAAGGADDAGFANCNALHLLVIHDIFDDEVFRLFINHGAQLSAPCRARGGEEIPGLLLPRRLGRGSGDEEQLDAVLGEEVKYLIRTSRNFNATKLNAFLEMGSDLKSEHGVTTYRFIADVDFDLSGLSAVGPPPMGQNEEASTALLYAADVGNAEALRLLLYAGANTARTAQRVLPFDAGRGITVPAQAVHLALMRADLDALEHLLLFGIDPETTWSGQVHRMGAVGAGAVGVAAGAVEEQWTDLGLVHTAVLGRHAEVLPWLLQRGCGAEARARRRRGGPGAEAEEVTPLRLAVLLADVRCTAQLLDSGALVGENIRVAAMETPAVCEMFGGPPVVGLEEWTTALLTGEGGLRALLERRTDPGRELQWPEDPAAVRELLESHRLANPELVARLEHLLSEAPTKLQGLRPVHLACLLEQPWALGMLADAGAEVAAAPPCREVPVFSASDEEDNYPKLTALPLSAVLLCARAGSLRVLEALCREPAPGLNARAELPITPDLSPFYFPRRGADGAGDAGAGGECAGAEAPTWAWSRLGPLEVALLHRRVDAAVLLVRLGADLLHTVDHVAVRAPTHYSVTDACFRGLTPLHLCALLDLRVAATALLNEACSDGFPVVPNEYPRAQRQALLTARCTQAWATVASNGRLDKEPWLWRDVTPLHLAILRRNYAVAEQLIEVSTADTLMSLCVSRDIAGDMDRSFSALLLAYEHNRKDLHRKIAKRCPTC